MAQGPMPCTCPMIFDECHAISMLFRCDFQGRGVKMSGNTGRFDLSLSQRRVLSSALKEPPGARTGADARASRASAQLEVLKPLACRESGLFPTEISTFSPSFPTLEVLKSHMETIAKTAHKKPLGPCTSRSSSRTWRSRHSRAPHPHCSAALAWPPWNPERSPSSRPSRSPPPDQISRCRHADIVVYT